MKVKATMEGTKELRVKFNRLSAVARVENLVTAAKAGAMVFVNGMKTRAPKKTRNLARSIHMEVVKEGEKYAEVASGTDLEYALIQERGGVIKPKNAKFLAIPLTEAAKAAVSPRNFNGKLTPKFSKGERGVLEDETGVAHYALVKSVRIPAHPYARPTFDQDQEQAQNAAAAALRKLLEAAVK